MIELIRNRINSLTLDSTLLDLSEIDLKKLTDEEVSEIVKLISSIPAHVRSISFASCNLQDGRDEIVEAIPKHIIQVDLSANSEIDLQFTTKFMHSDVQVLNLSSNFLIEHDMELSDFNLSNILPYLPKNLSSLDLSCNLADSRIPVNNSEAYDDDRFDFGIQKLTVDKIKLILEQIIRYKEYEETIPQLRELKFSTRDVANVNELQANPDIQALLYSINPHFKLMFGNTVILLQQVHFTHFEFSCGTLGTFYEAHVKDIDHMLSHLPESVRLVKFSCGISDSPEAYKNVIEKYLKKNPLCTVDFHGQLYVSDKQLTPRMNSLSFLNTIGSTYKDNYWTSHNDKVETNSTGSAPSPRRS